MFLHMAPRVPYPPHNEKVMKHHPPPLPFTSPVALSPLQTRAQSLSGHMYHYLLISVEVLSTLSFPASACPRRKAARASQKRGGGGGGEIWGTGSGV